MSETPTLATDSKLEQIAQKMNHISFKQFLVKLADTTGTGKFLQTNGKRFEVYENEGF